MLTVAMNGELRRDCCCCCSVIFCSFLFVCFYNCVYLESSKEKSHFNFEKIKMKIRPCPSDCNLLPVILSTPGWGTGS